MIGIVHGYGLDGSGSNLWTREIVAALCESGRTVHLVCQEQTPEAYPFITEAWAYGPDGSAARTLHRSAHWPGRCILHVPRLDVLPTYVRPDRPSDRVRSILDLDGATIEEYLRRNVLVLEHLVSAHDLPVWHVNHAALLSEALRRVKRRHDIAYAVMPHGSALEYVVRHDPRILALARAALAEADHLFALSPEISGRLRQLFPELDLRARTSILPVGVDTRRFRPVARRRRAERVRQLTAALHGTLRGHAPVHTRRLHDAVAARPGHPALDPLRAAIERDPGYSTQRPDADLEHRFAAVAWSRDPVVAFVGRLIPAKGVQALAAAFPLVLAQEPRARLLIVGAGWLREYIEAFLAALAGGYGERARRILAWADERANDGARPSGSAFIERLRRTRRLDAYLDAARRHRLPDRVLFTGYLEHPLLARVLPLADVAVFPSAVAEASPLVVPEAAACGCFPVGTDFAGMRHALHDLDPHVPPHLRPLLRLHPHPARTAHDIARHVPALLRTPRNARRALRRAAVAGHDWRHIADAFARQLNSLRPV